MEGSMDRIGLSWRAVDRCEALGRPHTLVMAAVSVVFPWSTCPMVPMLTCGLLRT